jgi:pyruvate dehydrogenase E1 component alpha subunit
MYTKDFLTNLYRTVFTIRLFETECIKLYRQGLIRGYFHPYLGEEAVAVGVCAALRPEDYIVSTHRGHGHCIARGARIDRMIAELLGKKAGYCKGLGGSMHIADVATGNLGANGIVGGGIPIGVGAALGAKLRGEKRVVAIFFSDGATNNGVFAESLNLAAIWNLPVIFVLENNHYAVSTPIEQSSRNPDLYQRARGYDVKASAVDGNDVLKVYEKTMEAIEACLQGHGPVLIEAKTFRHGGHHVNDPGSYMPEARVLYFQKKDPLKIIRKDLIEMGQTTVAEIEEIEAEVIRQMEQAIEFAKNGEEIALTEFMDLVRGY